MGLKLIVGNRGYQFNKMKCTVCIVAFFSFCYSILGQVVKKDSSKPRGYSAEVTNIEEHRANPYTISCYVRPYDKYHGFNKGDRVEWKHSDESYTGIIIDLSDTEKCLVKVDDSDVTVKVFYHNLTQCHYCDFGKGHRIQWWKDSGELYTGVIIGIKKKICFVRLYEDSSIVNFNLSYTDITRCEYCYFQKGDHVEWVQPAQPTYWWNSGVIVDIPKDKNTIFIKVDFDTATIDFALSQRKYNLLGLELKNHRK